MYSKLLAEITVRSFEQKCTKYLLYFLIQLIIILTNFSLYYIGSTKILTKNIFNNISNIKTDHS